jgi:hypothetical protein
MNALRAGCLLFVAIAIAGCGGAPDSTSSHQIAPKETAEAQRGPGVPSNTLPEGEPRTFPSVETFPSAEVTPPPWAGPKGREVTPPWASSKGLVVTTREFLSPSKREDAGYGLYSYLLLACEPTDKTSRARCLAAIDAYLVQLRPVGDFGDYIERASVNVMYCLVKVAPPPSVTVEWVLDHYDYARAQVFLAKVHASCVKGPYIVSYTTPLSDAKSSLWGECLYQDLSSVHADFIPVWVKEFRIQAAQERYWDRRILARFGLRFRDYLREAAGAWPPIKEGLKDWVKWPST